MRLAFKEKAKDKEGGLLVLIRHLVKKTAMLVEKPLKAVRAIIRASILVFLPIRLITRLLVRREKVGLGKKGTTLVTIRHRQVYVIEANQVTETFVLSSITVYAIFEDAFIFLTDEPISVR